MSVQRNSVNSKRNEKPSKAESTRKRKSSFDHEIDSKRFKRKETNACKEIEIKSPCIKAKTVKKLKNSKKNESPKTKKLHLATSPNKQLKKTIKTEKTYSKKNLLAQKLNVKSSSTDCESPKLDFKLSSKDEEFLANTEEISLDSAKNIIKLFEEENTIPFIARYRNDLTGNLQPDKLRKIKTTYDYIINVKAKAQKLIKKILAVESPPTDLLNLIQNAQTLEELDFLSAPYKKDGKRSLAEQAKKLGLQKPANIILEGEHTLDLEDYVHSQTKGLEDIKKVKLGIQHIIADIIAKNEEVLKLLKNIESSEKLVVHSELRADKKNKKEWSKYDFYSNFSQAVKFIKPHQTLAINRGESEKFLSVKIVIPDLLWEPIKAYCKNKWEKQGIIYALKQQLIKDSVEDAIKRLLTPLVVRRVRSKLRLAAEEEAINTFGVNVKQLLLVQPFQGKIIMGIDPGFKNGCKVAVISCTGSVLDHDKFFLNQKESATEKLVKLVLKHGCTTIALGNGVGCRETEFFLSDLIDKKVFKPYDVCYTIVSEQGVSVYSCSEIAKEEFPFLDITIVSAVSIARRLQNPLSELVKVEPKNLGVGMYQYDVPEKKLQCALEEIVSECVSFVGVDINSASIHLLRRVAGLNDSKAKEILKYRTENCSFKSREDIKNVKGIKTKTFLQCAGFIRIIPTTAKCKCSLKCHAEFNPLDETPIHPESYKAVSTLVNKFDLKVNDIGSPEFINSIKKTMNLMSIESLAKLCECSNLSMEFIVQTLMQEKNFDIRSLSSGSMFKKEVKKFEDIKEGQTLRGVVRNIVPFGAFVDIGVGNDGLIHVSKMRNQVLQINDQVAVTVISVDVNKKKIELKLEEKNKI